MELSRQERQTFLESLWQYYAEHGRTSLPWRQPEHDGTHDPYKILVSELMLQQTQVQRVIPKYLAFLDTFPSVHELAAVELADVLRAWQGLGYNRRAKFLWQAAQMIDSHGQFPATPEELVKLPGIGANTAGAIMAYAYNQPVVFIETNVRTVYIHHFFADQIDVSDAELRPYIEHTVDQENPREFYWALMDYGSHLKATVGNASKASRHYSKQSAFQGSRRQIRGHVIRLLGEQPQTKETLVKTISDERLPGVLDELVAEELIRYSSGIYKL